MRFEVSRVLDTVEQRMTTDVTLAQAVVDLLSQRVFLGLRGVLGELLVLVEHLRRIAPRAAVDAVLVAPTLLRAVAPAAAAQGFKGKIKTTIALTETAYDLLGRVTSITLPDPAEVGGSNGPVRSFAYDALDRLARVGECFLAGIAFGDDLRQRGDQHGKSTFGLRLKGTLETGALRRFVNVYVGGDEVRRLQGLISISARAGPLH